VEILAQSSTAFVLTHNFQGTHILGASRGRLSDSVASCFIYSLAIWVPNVITGTSFLLFIPILLAYIIM